MKKAILRTLAYADVFDYPLTSNQLHRFLITARPISLTQLQKLLAPRRYHFLPGRQKIVSFRRRRESLADKKLKIAYRVAGWLKFIPTIEMIAVTGALAMKNSDKNDDIDLLMVTAKNRLWLTRGVVVTILWFLGCYRRPDKIKDMICPNMFLDETHLSVPPEERDLFTAHEVCQLLPLWDRNDIYQKFVAQNQWVKKYLANWRP
jgi:hypothetical protein